MKRFIILSALALSIGAAGCKTKTVLAETTTSSFVEETTEAVVVEETAATETATETHTDLEAAELTSADYEAYEATIARMKSDIDADAFPAEFMETLDEDMGEMWLIDCTDEIYLAEKTVEIKDYWNAKHNKTAETKSQQTNKNNQQSKPAESKSQQSKPAESNSQQSKPAETQAPAQNNTGSGAIDAEAQAYLDRINSADSAKRYEDAQAKDIHGNGALSEADQNVGIQ